MKASVLFLLFLKSFWKAQFQFFFLLIRIIEVFSSKIAGTFSFSSSEFDLHGNGTPCIKLVPKSVYLYLKQLQITMIQILQYFKELTSNVDVFFKTRRKLCFARFSLDDQEIIRLAGILPPSSANNIQVVEQEIFFSRGQIF